ncbi:SulP family inorganic anion transporter [Lentzea sp. NPDC034063]|uniref:SulP family inorganic anion transporter n=1 Tax=unclassified Lentzea TaxID=2643253 RepID=UPI0033E839F1
MTPPRLIVTARTKALSGLAVDGWNSHRSEVAAGTAAALAVLESLLSATVADGMSVNQRHDPDREPFGQGIANVITPVFAAARWWLGVPRTAAVSADDVRVGLGMVAGSAGRGSSGSTRLR